MLKNVAFKSAEMMIMLTHTTSFNWMSVALQFGDRPALHHWSIGLSSHALGTIYIKPPPVSVPEMAHAGVDHGKSGFISGIDDLVITHRSTRLNDCGGASFRSCQQTIGEGEERI